MNDKKTHFSLGVFIGMVIGIVTGMFISPRSGKENRELLVKKIKDAKEILESEETKKKVKEIFGTVSDTYIQFKKEMSDQLDNLQKNLQQLDKDKYILLIKDTVEVVKKETSNAEEKLNKLKDYLVGKWKDREK